MFISHFCHACNPYHENHICFSLSIMQIMPSILSVIRAKHVTSVQSRSIVSCLFISINLVNHIISVLVYHHIDHNMSIYLCQSYHACLFIIIAATIQSYSYFPHNHKGMLNNTYHVSNIMFI